MCVIPRGLTYASSTTCGRGRGGCCAGHDSGRRRGDSIGKSSWRSCQRSFVLLFVTIGQLTGAITIAECDDGTGISRTARSVGAVADAIAKVHVLAQACRISGSAAKGGSQAEHVADAGLLR